LLGFVRMNNHNKTQNLYKREQSRLKEDDWFLSSDLAKEFGYNISYIGLLARKGKVQSKKENGSWYLNKNSLIEYIDRTQNNQRNSEVKQVPRTCPSGGGWFLLSVLAKEFGYDISYVGAIARQGKVQAVKTNGKWYIKRDSLVAYQIQAKQNQINSGIKEVPKVQIAKTDTDVPYIAPSSLSQRASNPVVMGRNLRAAFVVLLFFTSMITGVFFTNNKATILDFIRGHL